ncbi:FG-GAP-like repeat-containing protein, partial [Winogradskyella sp.]|nr:FG-GAP-like repeat-containing protein [Winogradskyella sp.]
MKIIVAFFMLFSIIKLSAQSNTVAVGVEATGSGGTVSFTGGEVFYTYKSSSTGSVTEGVQQSYFAPSLGNYSDPSIATAGGNATVSPDAAPTGGANITVYTTTDFKGLLTVNQSTGAVTITNAHPAGTYEITVDAGGGVLENFTLTVGNTLCSQGQFYASATVGAAIGSYAIVADFNNDGYQDIASQTLTNQFSVSLGDGAGGFDAPINTTTPLSSISDITIGDFNGDGKQDIATTHYSTDKAAIFLGNGDGSFTNGQQSIAVGNGPQSLVVGDFNEDGKQDIAVANQNYGAGGSVSILIGNGLGVFTVSTPVSVGLDSKDVVIGDFNADGHQDLATTNPTDDTVSINLGIGDGTFAVKTDISVGATPTGIAIGDFNNDGYQDFTTSNYTANTVSIVLGQGNGTFAAAPSVTVGTGPWDVKIGDFNGDGNQDIVSANRTTDNVSVRLGDGTGLFTGATEVSVGNNPLSITLGDFNQDGLQDIAAAVSIRLGGIGEINLQGNATDIVSGDNTPDAADDTDFGTVGLNTPSTKTYTIQNTGTSPLTVNSIGISGTDASDFVFNNITLPATVPAGGETTFDVTFTTATLGTKTATVTISSDDCDESTYSFSVQGKVESYTVSFNSNGGTGTMSSQAIVYLASENLTVNSFIRTGYTFAGWNTAADGTGTDYADQAAYTMGSADV